MKAHERNGRSRHSGGSYVAIESTPIEEQSHRLISTILKPKLTGQAAKKVVLGRALVILVDSERPIVFTTRRVGPKQPRRVVEHHLCGLE